MSYFQRLIVNTLTFITLHVILPDNMLYVKSIWVALLASLILSVLNTLIKPILQVLSLPITVLTLGLFSFVINGAILSLTSTLIGADKFSFSSFGAAMFVSIIMSLVNSVMTDKGAEKYY